MGPPSSSVPLVEVVSSNLRSFCNSAAEMNAEGSAAIVIIVPGEQTIARACVATA